jgi:outer membrane receptor protein involved in Fe transport
MFAACGIARAQTQPAPQPAQAARTAIISGLVVDQNGGLPVAGAQLALQQGAKTVARTATSASGAFTFRAVPLGIYTLLVQAPGYQSGVSQDIALAGDATVNLTLVRSTATAGLRTIANVRIGGAGTLQTTTTIQHNVDTNVVQQTNQTRLAETLAKVPGVNAADADSSRGDDIGIDIRGLKPSETQILLDGHPIGPTGVYPGWDIGGGTGGFDLADSPVFALKAAQITYGSGASGLYGVDAVGGAIDFQTLDPTKTPQGLLRWGYGDQGTQLFSAGSTGTFGKLGYAVVHGVNGTYGQFEPQLIAQTGARGNDWTSSTLAADTYLVSGNVLLRNDMAKLVWSFSPNTSLTLTGYSATSWDDKTGNGDNDFITSDYAAYQAASSPNCTIGSSSSPNGITVTTDSGNVCVTPQEYGRVASGPSGGGQGPFQALRNQDYHVRFSTMLGKHQVVLDSFIDNYGQDRERPASNINGDLSVLTRIFRTYGTLISDDIANEKNDVGFGFYTQRQYTNGDQISGATGLIPTAALYSKLDSFFVRDAFTPSDRISYFMNAWFKHSLIGGNSFDPRLSVIFRPTPRDVLRLTGGASSADPAPIAFELTGAGGINPGNCQLFSLGSLPTPGELPEKAKDVEASVGHRFGVDDTLEFTAYDTNETNTIFEADLPAAPYVGTINQLYGPSYLSGVYSHISSICPNFAAPNAPPTISNLTVATNVNLATSRARGLELNGRVHVTPHLSVEAYYNVQSAAVFDMPVTILMNNPTLINGSQLPNIPLHTYGLIFDLTNTHGEEVYLNYTHYDDFNSYNRPAFGEADAFFNARLSDVTSLNLGISNIFNAATDDYGRIGWGIFHAENQYGPDTNALQQGSERFGLSPMSFTFSVTQKI